MSSTKEVKKRMRSVKNIAQITKAMEAVSANKMRKSQEFALRARPYAVASLEMLSNLLSRSAVLPPLLTSRPVRQSLIVVIVSDKGLASAFNSNVLRKAENHLRVKKAAGEEYAILAVGKKAKDYFERRREQIKKYFIDFGDFSEREETEPLADYIMSGFIEGIWDEAIIFYTHFRTTMKQEAVQKKILPITTEGIKEIVEGILPERGRFSEFRQKEGGEKTFYHYEYIFEPSAAEILEKLVPVLLRMHIHHIILESNASEHSARMVAMKAASDNARELIDDLRLVYNKARQAGITRELSEITAGKEALEQ